MINDLKVKATHTMKAVFSHQRKVVVREVERPEVSPNHVLVKTIYSGISNGTERLMLNHNHANPISLGYNAVGIVQEVGEGIDHVAVGDHVACYGAPYVRHAEYLHVPRHLVATIPAEVDLKEAAFVGLGAIAIHAIRKANLQFGERVVIVGLGILGQIIAQIANAASYHTLVFDLEKKRTEMFAGYPHITSAQTKEQLTELVQQHTQGQGVDAVLLCANGSNTGLIDDGLDWIRDRGRVVIVGDLTMNFSREKMFKKEAEVLISRAGGPGRYDATYERDGIDYPIGMMRWTEGRNMEEYIRLLQTKQLDIAPLISQTVCIDEIEQVYEKLLLNDHQALGTIISYNS